MRRARFIAVAVLAASIASLISVPSLSAAPDGPSPLEKAKSFDFTLSLKVGGSGQAPAFSIDTDGSFKRNAGEACHVVGMLGTLNITQRAVAKSNQIWMDTGSGFRVAKKKDFDFAEFCASDPAFWEEFDLSLPAGVQGIAEPLNGVASRRYDLSALGKALSSSGVFKGLPAGVAIDSMNVWVADKGGFTLAFDLAFSGSTAEACGALAGQSGVNIPTPCFITVDSDSLA